MCLPAMFGTLTAQETSCRPVVPCVDPRGCPDLVVSRDSIPDHVDGLRNDKHFLVEIRTFTETDCVVVEGQVSAGTRRLLDLRTRSGNRGPGVVHFGNPLEHPDWFDLQTCHGHPHLKDYADYRLWTIEGYREWAALRAGDPGGCSADLLAEHPEVAAQRVNGPGKKRGFCLADTFIMHPDGSDHFHCPAGTSPDHATYFDCDFGGLSVCWADSYPGGIDGQWVDITGLPDGTYVLEIEINDTRLITETDYSNNSTAVLVAIEGNSATMVGTP
jgi:hypothetical protein